RRRPRSPPPEETGHRIERQGERVATAVGEDFVDVRHDVTQLCGCQGHAGLLLDLSHHLWRHISEGIVGRHGAIRIQPEDDACEVRVVGRRTAELVVGLTWPEWSIGDVLQLAAPALIADLEIELAVRPEYDL